MWRRVISDEVRERIERLDLPFNRWGLDPYGISKDHLGLFLTVLGQAHKHYFRVRTRGIENVPGTGPAMLVSNHSGGLPTDGGMIVASIFFDREPPRLAHGMVEKFAQSWPFMGPWFSRVGQLPGLPEHAKRLLLDGRLLMVFPEGARGTGKLYRDRYQLERFGTGFMRIALETGVPIVPIAFIGGEEAIPTIYHAKYLAKLANAPYFPITPYILPVPLPVNCEVLYGAPMHFEGTGNEPDHVIDGYVAQVKARVEELIAEGRGAGVNHEAEAS
ncbi:2-acyl-glycerophospho-ethanolamine acyltransferase [Enhygromyxa salina]|uniref:2-acyl-glycerophospho-ethanolamine acyltransferase n=1 Tax=Enhygromyxa salina TaxID=215803 RepID=A0A2S9XHP6_9BACT|nr:lysophospholipid acyltransferase family protein [Enhygromyxa salina]PRP92399.1 2-acyl-glycerophospho-ethanolamine acyltransferase [Enhygromyxa salina]